MCNYVETVDDLITYNGVAWEIWVIILTSFVVFWISPVGWLSRVHPYKRGGWHGNEVDNLGHKELKLDYIIHQKSKRQVVICLYHYRCHLATLARSNYYSRNRRWPRCICQKPRRVYLPTSFNSCFSQMGLRRHAFDMCGIILGSKWVACLWYLWMFSTSNKTEKDNHHGNIGLFSL